MDDNEKAALLAELETAWAEPTFQEDVELIRAFASRTNTDVSVDRRRFAAAMYLAAKRRYDKAPEPVKTRMRFEEWERSTQRPESHFDMQRSLHRKEGWDAALANVQQGIEVGQPCQVFDHHKQAWVDGVYGASDSLGVAEYVTFWSDPACVRSAPKTVDLTDDEKLTALMNSPKAPVDRRLLQLIIIEGKTLDELCKEHGVETKRSV